MRTEYFISMDAHCRTTDTWINTATGKLVGHDRTATTIPHLRQIVESVPRPRYLTFEESSIAGWLYRGLKDLVDEIVVCDPKRNAHIARDGDKDDPIDAEKLNHLYRSGHLRKVHQSDSKDQAANKQLVGMYHNRVSHRTAEGSRLLALGKRWGLLLTSSMLMETNARENLRKRFEQAQVPASMIGVALDLWDGYELAVKHEEALHQNLCRMVKDNLVMRRTAELPGYGPVRSATLITYWETPWRFKSKSALFKYNGIGLVRKKSGDGYEFIRVEQECNRLLRCVVIGAAQHAINQKENLFAKRHARWIQKGLSPGNARRNVARDQVATIWGMWKTNTAFDPSLLPEMP
jgi:transposase